MNNRKKRPWTAYMNRRRAFQIALILYVPLIAFVQMVAADFTVVFFIAFGLLFVLPLGIRHIFFPCPNCGFPIHFKQFASFLGKICSHCGIKIGAPLDEPK